MLYQISDFIEGNLDFYQGEPNYYYQGFCPHTGELLTLPRTPLAEAISHGLMKQLTRDNGYNNDGKMYGILIVELDNGEQRVLKAFSGLSNQESLKEGWVTPILGREKIALQEQLTLAELNHIKQQLIHLSQMPEINQYQILVSQFNQELGQLKAQHKRNKKQRQIEREKLNQTLTGDILKTALEKLDQESRLEGIARRNLKTEQNLMLQPLEQKIAAAEQEINTLKQKRKNLSAQLQNQMNLYYQLTNFAGKTYTLQQLIPTGAPTGTGDCCAPKLLNYAALHHLKPLAMAEFWWGKTSINQEKKAGQFYPACTERCQPIMGFLLSGIPSTKHQFQEIKLEIIYVDEYIIAINKPAGMLSVPGRYSYNQDSVYSQLQATLNNEQNLYSVHRLDQETSGILLLARDKNTHRFLSQQFENRQIYKLYEAILNQQLKTQQGTIELPLWGDTENRPYQTVNFTHGKPSITHYQVLATTKNSTRIEFIPVTGRTHQLRVHSSHIQGLNSPILGDRFYGCTNPTNRLHLHAREIGFQHPQLKTIIHLQTKTPF